MLVWMRKTRKTKNVHRALQVGAALRVVIEVSREIWQKLEQKLRENVSETDESKSPCKERKGTSLFQNQCHFLNRRCFETN